MSYRLLPTPAQERLMKRLSWVLNTLPKSCLLQSTLEFEWFWRKILDVPYTGERKHTSVYSDMLGASYTALSCSPVAAHVAIGNLPNLASAESSAKGTTLHYRGGSFAKGNSYRLDIALTSPESYVVLETADLPYGTLSARKHVILLYCTIHAAILYDHR